MDVRLREVIANSFDSIEESERIVITLEEIKHGSPRPIGEAQNGFRCMYNPWKPLANPRLLSLHKDLLLEKIHQYNWDFDTILTISTTAIPIATIISIESDKRLLVCDNITFRFLPTDPRPEDKILIIDSMIQSGYHLNRVVDSMEYEFGFINNISGCAVFTYNNLIQAKLPIVDEWLKEKKLIYLYTLEDVYKEWKIAIKNRSSST